MSTYPQSKNNDVLVGRVDAFKGRIESPKPTALLSEMSSIRVDPNLERHSTQYDEKML